MKVAIDEIELKNFNAHKDFRAAFDEVVKISGKNGEGKSSIGESITWNLFGTDTLANTFDPTPTHKYEGEVSSTVLLNVDGKKVKMKRIIEGGKNVFYINDVPRKATEYKEFVDSLIDRNLFLSIFNPNYFSSQHWKEQREQLLKYVDEPLNKEVLDQMQNVFRAAIEDELKKHSLNELDKLHRDRFRKRDKEIERAGERVATLKEQLEKSIGAENADLTEVASRLSMVEAEIIKARKFNDVISVQEKNIFDMKAQETEIRSKIAVKRLMIENSVGATLNDSCSSCGQSLDFNAREQLKQSNLEQIEAFKQKGRELVGSLEKIKAALAAIGQTAVRIDIFELIDEAERLRHVLMDSKRISNLQQEIIESEDDYQRIRTERNESVAIIDSIKVFVNKKASMMVEKVNSLFDTLSVKLFEEQKNGSIKQTFELEMDGKPFQKLSNAEKVKAGIQLIRVLQNESDIICPTFIDNAESILNIKAADGQLFTATVKNHKLKIEGEKTA